MFDVRSRLNMPMFFADNSCIRCGLCTELCPVQAIVSYGDKPSVAPGDERKCFRCGQCVAFCPTRSIHLAFQPENERVKVEPFMMPSAAGAETLLRSRRSIRRYKNILLPETTVRNIIETARYAPSAGNSQPTRWIVVRARARVLQLADRIADVFDKWAADNPGNREFAHLAAISALQRTGTDVIFRGAPNLAIAVVPQSHHFPEDAAIALTYFELAAHALGVGCCWAGFFTIAARKHEPLTQSLGVRTDEFVVGAQMFGYPDGISVSRTLPPRKQTDITFV